MSGKTNSSVLPRFVNGNFSGSGSSIVFGYFQNFSTSVSTEGSESSQVKVYGKAKETPGFSMDLGLVGNEINTEETMKYLHDFIKGLKASTVDSLNSVQDEVHSGQSIDHIVKKYGSKDLQLNWSLEDISDLNNLLDYNEYDLVNVKNVLIIALYALIAIVSIIGNLLVVQLVIRSRRLHTLTHALLANLAVADLLMATLNIPLSAVRVIMPEWPFGSFLCHIVPFVQVTSVYVTSITMAVIAVDRYQVIMNPLGRRMKKSQGIYLVIIIWSVAGFLSLPYAIHHKVVTVLTVKIVNRCQAEFPSMLARRWLTVATVLAQYVAPLMFTATSYVSIMRKLGLRSSSSIGSTTPRQVAAQSKAKRTTIKMLVLTVFFFAVCWAPINAYHLLTHFHLVLHNSTAILVCHLIAMSSTCYNPFIYCWLNEHFRREAQKWLCCFCHSQYTDTRVRRVTRGGEINGILTEADLGKFQRNQRNFISSTTGAGALRSSSRPRQRENLGRRLSDNNLSSEKSDPHHPRATSSNSIFRADSRNTREKSSSGGISAGVSGGVITGIATAPQANHNSLSLTRILCRSMSNEAKHKRCSKPSLELCVYCESVSVKNLRAGGNNSDDSCYPTSRIPTTQTSELHPPETGRESRRGGCFHFSGEREEKECRV